MQQKKHFVQKSIFYGDFVKKEKQMIKHVLFMLTVREAFVIKVDVFTVRHHVKTHGSRSQTPLSCFLLSTAAASTQEQEVLPRLHFSLHRVAAELT